MTNNLADNLTMRPNLSVYEFLTLQQPSLTHYHVCYTVLTTRVPDEIMV